MMAHEIDTMDREIGTAAGEIGAMDRGIGTMDWGVGTMDRGVVAMDRGIGTMDRGIGAMDRGFETMDRGIVMILPALQQSRRGFFPQCIRLFKNRRPSSGRADGRLGEKSTRNGVKGQAQTCLFSSSLASA